MMVKLLIPRRLRPRLLHVLMLLGVTSMLLLYSSISHWTTSNIHSPSQSPPSSLFTQWKNKNVKSHGGLAAFINPNYNPGIYISDVQVNDIYADNGVPVPASSKYNRHSTSGWVGGALDRNGNSIQAKEWKLMELVEKRYDASMGNMIVLVVVDWTLRDMTLNWLCHVRSLNIHSYILIAADTNIRDYLISVYEPVVYEPSLSASKNNSKPMPTFEFLHTRLDLSIQVLKHKKYIVLLADVDSVWVDNPIPWIWNSMKDLQKGETVPYQTQRCGRKDFHLPCHIIAQTDLENRPLICIGLVAFCPKDSVIRLLQNASSTMEKESLQIINKQHSDQEVINHFLIPYDENQTEISWNVLNHQRFPPGRTFFVSTVKDYLSGSRLPPIVIHNNWLADHNKKQARFNNFGLWRVGEAEKGLCRHTGLPTKPLMPEMSIKVIILCNGNLRGFLHAMNSLMQTTGVATTHTIGLEIMLNPALPKHELGIYAAKIKKMRWLFGPFTYRLGGNDTQALAEQWANIWGAQDEYGAVLIGDEMLRVSPYWYVWSVNALAAKCDDVDLDVDGRIATVTPLLSSSMPPHHYRTNPIRIQERSTWNRVFIKHHWKQFYRWLVTRPLNYIPGFPYATYPRVKPFNSSIWDRSWSYHHSTFMGEKGLWTLSSKAYYPSSSDSIGIMKNLIDNPTTSSNNSGHFPENVSQVNAVAMWEEIKQDLSNCHASSKSDYWAAPVISAGALSHRWWMLFGSYPLERKDDNIPEWLAMNEKKFEVKGQKWAKGTT